ncbi:restriction endonuclease subunit S [Tenacibaculum salmonis]|uniref:restriction endonuclease subunit S n=1 Tax=Tenacibaculum sp. P3-BQ1 TaxID=3232310 RepID=UPI0034DE48F5
MQLLKHFKELTVNPKNAKELKGLILQLAIQGKLTANWRKENTNIEPASELLKKIRKEKLQLIKEKKVRKGKLINRIKKEEKYLEIPEKWVWIRLIEVGNIFNGNSVNKSTKALKYEGLKDGFSYLGTKDINYGFEDLNYDNGVKIPFDEPRFKIAHKNTVLICSEGGSAGKKCGITIEDICFGNKLYALEQYGNIETVYILSIYKTPIFFELFQSKMTGIIGGISINNFGEIPIPIPPLEEQKEIVKIVEMLFKEVDKLEQLTVSRISLKEDFVRSALKELTNNNTKKEWDYLQEHFKSFFNETTNIKKLRETVLQLAVQGKLTADWRANNPSTEDATILLKRIQKEKTQLIEDKKIKKEKILPKITKEEIPYELPKSWVWCRMQEIGLFERGKSKHRPRNDFRLFSDGKYPFVQTGDVSSAKKNGGIVNTHKSLYNDFGLAQSRMWNKGTLCITIAANIAETGVLGFNACFPDSVVGFTNLVSGETSRYVECFITIMKSDLEKYAPSTAQKNINLGILYELKFPLPPLEEQKAIVQKVNALMSLCDKLEQEVQQSEVHSTELMKSCLKEVFVG